jgi:hypothetical protein
VDVTHKAGVDVTLHFRNKLKLKVILLFFGQEFVLKIIFGHIFYIFADDPPFYWGQNVKNTRQNPFNIKRLIVSFPIIKKIPAISIICFPIGDKCCLKINEI